MLKNTHNDSTDVRAIEAIDVHGHYGTFGNPIFEHATEFLSGDAPEVARRARACNIAWTMVSPFVAFHPRFGGDAVTGNKQAWVDVAATPGLLQWVVVHPLQPDTFDQARDTLQHPQCVGIKIHPEEHGYPIREHGDRLFKFAAECGAPILTHSGEPNSLPIDFVPFADQYPGVRLILAHLGCGYDNDRTHQIRAIQAAAHDNVFVDTSSASSIFSGLVEWAVKEVGAAKILFGTDTPLYSTAMQRARIDSADVSFAAKTAILRDNARRLFKAKLEPGK